MLSYRHGYHAGNFADVLKHSVLVLLLERLRQKDTPFFFLDTHAGAGRYDLRRPEAQQTGEFKEGIGRLWALTEVPAELEAYLAAVRAFNEAGELHWYPGSPRLIRQGLRAQDRMAVCELHPNEIKRTKAEFAGDRQVAVHLLDGYQALAALLPPREKRGAVLIDPSYEVKDDFDRVVRGLQEGLRRWPTATFVIWYPILAQEGVARFHRALVATGVRKILCAELWVRPLDAPLGLNGSGMILVNPPWQLEAGLQRLLPWLQGALAQHGAGGHRLLWLAPE